MTSWQRYVRVRDLLTHIVALEIDGEWVEITQARAYAFDVGDGLVEFFIPGRPSVRHVVSWKQISRVRVPR